MHSHPTRCPQTRRFLLVLCALFVAGSALAAEAEKRSGDDVWVARRDAEWSGIRARRGSLPRAYRAISLDPAKLQTVLFRAPMEVLEGESAKPRAILQLPMPDGSFTRLAIEESPILSPALQAQHPGIRTYRGEGIDDPTMTARLDLTTSGFHGQLISEHGTVLIDPVEGPGADLYISYWKRDAQRAPFHCLTEDVEIGEFSAEKVRAMASGNELRTYRMAVSATGEYTTFFGGTTGATNQITTTMNRVTGIYERDVAVRFNVTRFNIYTDPATDPFTDPGTIDTLLNENQTDLDAGGMAGTYDIGHILSQGGSGGKAPGDACTADKAKGATNLDNPSGDAFDVDFVAHEVGHQMGANHTYDGNTNTNCAGQRTAGSAYEPGGGTTIMAYAGICGTLNIQNNSDDYFHTHSYDQIRAFQAGTGACGTTAATGNGVPTVNAGADFTIPQSTPFRLTASGSDPDGHALTYTWEQFDLGPGTGPPSATYDGPLFRSRRGNAAGVRVLPLYSDLLAGTVSQWEMLAGKNRDLTFRAQVRDNRANGGGSDHDTMVVHVSGAPFAITSPRGLDILQCGAPTTIDWNKGGSTAANVRALLSTNNGGSYSTWVSSTGNDGSHTVNVPMSTVTTQGRLELQPTDNIYFSLSGSFRITDTADPSVNAPANLANVECTQCSPQGASPSIGSATATDACDPTLSISNNKPSVFPLGSTTVTWSATDDSGNDGTDTQSVSVVDTTDPSLTAPGSVVRECTGPAGTPVSLGSATANDICWCSVSVTNNGPALFPLGTTTVTWTALDGSGNSSTATQNVTVQDTTPPTLTVALSPGVLWPVNHKLVTIRASITTTDICDSTPTVRLISISSNEPDDTTGDGHTSADIQDAAFGTDDREFKLRAERRGNGNSRIYTVVYESRDDSGNFTLRESRVVVPHQQ